MPRYGDRMREREPPETIVIPERSRRRSPPSRYVERDYEDIRVSEPDFYDNEELRGYRERERSTVRRRRAPNEVEYERDVEIERTEEVEDVFPKKGRTRMPKRLVDKAAIISLGYPFEEEVGDVSDLQPNCQRLMP